ncbi:retrovirus-related pol polyprotein from transposon TNT 1-94 [Tanacetum coccineum]
MVDEMLRQRCTSGDEHQYHIDQMKNFLKSNIVWESRKEILVSPHPQKTTPLVQSCQRDPEAPPLSLINQDLLYLKKGSSGPEKIVLSLHKFPAIIFNDDDIEERTSRWVNTCVKKFNPYAQYGVEHWKNPHAKIFYIRKQKEPRKPKEVIYSNSKIIQVIKTYWELVHEHKFITKIVARRANECIVSITKPDYKNLNKNDIEDISSVIWERVHDFQIGIESYQQKVNLTAPTISFPGVEKHKMFSIIYEPVHGIIYKNSKKEKRVMRHSEIHKFCDATLNKVLEGLRSYNNDVKPIKSGPKVVFRDNSSGDTEGYGLVNCNGITFTRVAYANGLKHNLISISQLCDANFKVLFTKTQGTIFNQNNKVVLIAPRRRDVYVIDMSFYNKESNACFFAKASNIINWLWHKRLSYLNFKNINKLARHDLASKSSCDGCWVAMSRITCVNINGNTMLSEAQGVSLRITSGMRVRTVYHDLYLGGKALAKRENVGFDLARLLPYQTIFDALPGYVGLYTHSFSLANLRLPLTEFFCECSLVGYLHKFSCVPDPILSAAVSHHHGNMVSNDLRSWQAARDLSFLTNEPSPGFGNGSPSVSVNTKPLKANKEPVIQPVEVTANSGESPKPKLFVVHPGSVAAWIKDRKCKTRGGSSRPPDDDPFLTVSDDDGGLPDVLKLKDATSCHLKISTITPPAWKNHLDNHMDVELLDLHDRCYRRQAVVDNAINRRSRELLQVIEKLRGEFDVMRCSERAREEECKGLRVKCEAAITEFEKNPAMVALREKISTLSTEVKKARVEAVEVALRKEVEELKQDRREVGINEQVADMKEPFDLSKVNGYFFSYKKDHTQANNNFPTATFPWLDEFMADPSVPIEVLLSEKPLSLQEANPSRNLSPLCYFSKSLLHLDSMSLIRFLLYNASDTKPQSSPQQ